MTNPATAAEPLPLAADPAHLTQALRRSGVLGDGRVRAVVVESSHPTLVSRIARLRLAYEGASGPGSLILKTELPGRSAGMSEGGRHEVAFYTEIAAATPAGLVPRCFDAAHDGETMAWHVLLEDLGDSHVIATTWPVPPTGVTCERILRTLARFHAAWWEDRRLGVSVGTWPGGDAVARYLERCIAPFETFADRLGDRLPRERRVLYERFLEAVPRLLHDRLDPRRNLTLVHGDAHVWNFFLPRDGGEDVRLFDWDLWRIGLASSDLAYMMALHWYPERRRRMERALLDEYHRALVAAGVDGYDRRALDDDYRLSALLAIMIPVWQSAHDLPPMIWWGHLERIHLAVEDLGSRELLR